MDERSRGRSRARGAAAALACVAALVVCPAAAYLVLSLFDTQYPGVLTGELLTVEGVVIGTDCSE